MVNLLAVQFIDADEHLRAMYESSLARIDDLRLFRIGGESKKLLHTEVER